MKKKTLALALALCMTVTALVSFTAGAAAAGGLQTITAYLNSRVTVKLDGEAQTLLDGSGVRIYPITYNGTTYLPVRSIANILGIDVNWDQATQSVLLGKQPNGVDLIDTYTNYNHTTGISLSAQYRTGDRDPVSISGVTCSNYLGFMISQWEGGKDTVSSMSFNLGGKHDTLTFSYYSGDYCKLQVLGDNGTVLFEKAVNGGEIAQTVTIPLFKTSQLTIQITDVDWAAKATAYVFDARLDAE